MAIKKNDFESLKKKFSTSAKYKPQRFFDLGPDFLDAVGLPGPAIGHLNMLLGHSASFHSIYRPCRRESCGRSPWHGLCTNGQQKWSHRAKLTCPYRPSQVDLSNLNVLRSRLNHLRVLMARKFLCL